MYRYFDARPTSLPSRYQRYASRSSRLASVARTSSWTASPAATVTLFPAGGRWLAMRGGWFRVTVTFHTCGGALVPVASATVTRTSVSPGAAARNVQADSGPVARTAPFSSHV